MAAHGCPALGKRKPDCFAVKQYRKFKLSSGKTAKSILISCGARLAPFDIPQLRESMSYDELELDRMGDRRTATFFCISDTDSTYNFLVALAFSQMFNLLCERADNVHGGRLPHHVRVLWDEAANTGQVPQLEKLVAVIRSREISLCLLYQQLAQCKAIYDKNAETILGNMDSVLFLGGRESSTIKEISENWLGKATISMQTEGRSRGQSESYSQNTQRLGRELMTPSELATMPGDRCILQLRGLPPFYSKKYDLKQHPNYKYTAEADKVKNAFDLNNLVTRRMDKLNPKVYNLKQMAAALQYLKEHQLFEYDDLAAKTDAATERFHTLAGDIQHTEAELSRVSDLMAAVVQYAKTRPAFDGYKAAKYSRKYLAEHEAELADYRAAKATMAELLGGEKLPKMDVLKEKRRQLAARKKALYLEYRKAQQDMRELVAVKGSVDHLRGLTDNQRNKEQTR